MSQKVRIERVTLRGATPFLGLTDNDDPDSKPLYSRDPARLMDWLADGWRTRFNHYRSRRSKYGPSGELLPIGDRINEQTLPEARRSCTWLTAIPELVAASPEKLEKQGWFSAARRRATLRSQGKAPGGMPRFRSKVRDDQVFTCWFNRGRNAHYTRTGANTGMVTITGQNPKQHKRDGEKQRFIIRIHIRISEPIREYSSVRVNWTQRSLVFVNDPTPIQRTPTGAAMGYDRGVTHSLSDSNGDHRDLPAGRLARIDGEIRRRQKAQARSVKHSPHQTQRDYRKAGASKRFIVHDREITRLHQKARRVVADHQHKWTRAIVEDHDIVVLEDLKLAQMAKAPAPVPDPIRAGKYLPNGAAAKRGLNRVLAKSSLGQLREFLDYKAHLSGTQIIGVDPKNTSRRCHACGHTAAKNRKSQAVFACESCGHRANADTNAAANILERGLRMLHDQAALNTLQGRTVPDVEKPSDTGTSTAGTSAGSTKREPRVSTLTAEK